MKNNISRFSEACLAIAVMAIFAGSAGIQAQQKEHKHDHGHDHNHAKVEAGPNGGRILNAVEPRLEFFVTKDRKVRITAVGEDGKAISIGKQVVKVTGGDRSNPTRMTFEREGDVLLSNIAFPEGNDFPVVVQIKKNKLGKTVMEKFNLNLADCPTCDFAEYACTCDHSHDHKDHKH